MPEESCKLTSLAFYISAAFAIRALLGSRVSTFDTDLFGSSPVSASSCSIKMLVLALIILRSCSCSSLVLLLLLAFSAEC